MYSGTTPQNCRCQGPCALSHVSWFRGQSSTLHLLFTLKQSNQFQLTIFSVLSKKKKATSVPKEAPMLAMKALELRKKQDKVERTLLVVFHMTWT